MSDIIIRRRCALSDFQSDKDNDLRCRVTKRAARLFGQSSNAQKANWIATEFNKRKQKREQKERAKSDVPGSSNVFTTMAPEHHSQSAFSDMMASGDSGMGQSHMLRVFGGLMPGESHDHLTMDCLVDLILKAPPELVSELHKVATEISGADVPLYPPAPQQPQQLQIQPPQQQQVYTQPEPIEPPRVATPPPTPQEAETVGADPSSLEGLLQGLAAGGDVPEGFDLLLAELASEAQKPSPEPEAPKETPSHENVEIIENTRISEDLDPTEIDETNVDELLAALAAVESESSSDPTKELMDTISQQENIDELNALMDLDHGGSMDVFDEQALEQIINDCGIDVSGGPDGTDQHNKIDQNIPSSIDTSTEDTPMGNTEDASPENDAQEPAGMDFTMEELEGMTMEEINELLGELNPESAIAAHQLLNENHAQNMQTQAQSSHPVEAAPPAAPYAATSDPDTSAQYTPENVAAILKAIFEGIKLPANNFSSEPSRGSNKRPSPSSYGAPAAKRPRGPSPNVPPQSAMNQLQGILQSNPNVLRPPTHTPIPMQVSSAYAASFGNSDAMNKRINAMKPPPYRPGGGSSSPSASSAPIPSPLGIGIPLPPKRKSGEDEKKIKAMGFPPLMAGIKRKAD